VSSTRLLVLGTVRIFQPVHGYFVSDVNPLKHVVDGVRALFLGDVATMTVLWGLALGTRTFQRESG
jgi:ABC-type polysaccharide/polyol phosphate export permease